MRMILVLFPALMAVPSRAQVSKTDAAPAEQWEGTAVQKPEAAVPPSAAVDWVNIPGGTFKMGYKGGGKDENPVHAVVVKTFQMARTTVTFKQYKACVDAGRCSPAHVSDKACSRFDGSSWNKEVLPAWFQGDDHPAVCVTWDQAKAFSEWAGGRLPTEAEWEYAARSLGKEQKYPWGDQKPTCERAVMNEKGFGCGRSATWPVCSKPKGNSDQGLCDLAGNTWEWVQDWYHPSYQGAPADGRAWEDPPGKARVFRGGGSWHAAGEYLRVHIRESFNPDFANFYLGFRPARSLP